MAKERNQHLWKYLRKEGLDDLRMWLNHLKESLEIPDLVLFQVCLIKRYSKVSTYIPFFIKSDNEVSHVISVLERYAFVDEIKKSELNEKKLTLNVCALLVHFLLLS